jgi:hypothetical protein
MHLVNGVGEREVYLFGSRGVADKDGDAVLAVGKRVPVYSEGSQLDEAWLCFARLGDCFQVVYGARGGKGARRGMSWRSGGPRAGENGMRGQGEGAAARPGEWVRRRDREETDLFECGPH